MINIGNGYATGKGFITNAKITVERMKKTGELLEADIVYKGNENIEVSDQDNVLSDIMNSLMEVG